MTRLHVSNHGRVQVSMIIWMIEHIGPSDSAHFHGDVWNQMRRHIGDDKMYTQAQGRGWEIMYRLNTGNMTDGDYGIYVDIEDEEKAVLFALSWL